MDWQTVFNRYREVTSLPEYNELYKWRVYQDFMDKWDPDSPDFAAMLDSAIQPKNCNLWNSGQEHPRQFLVDFSQDHPEYVRDMLLALFDGGRDLTERIATFQRQSEELLAKDPSRFRTTYQRDHAISLWLSMRYPDTYYLYKFTMFKKFCRMTGLHEIPRTASKNNPTNLPAYFDFCNAVKEKVQADQDLLAWHRQRIHDEGLMDPINNLLVQDILYSVTNYEMNGQSALSDASIQVKETFLPNLNTILYGPPGTGKTYKTVNHALAIIENDPAYLNGEHDRSELRKKFEEYRNKRQIRFVTFHPSFSYEDFVEGIRPVINEDEEASKAGEIVYQVEDGIFKEICESAREALQLQKNRGTSTPIIPKEIMENGQFFKISLGNSTLDEDEAIYRYCIEHGKIALGYLSEVDCSGLTTADQIREKYRQVSEAYDPKDFGIEALKRFKEWMKPGDVVFVSQGNRYLRAIGLVEDGPDQGYTYEKDSPIGYPHFRKVHWLYSDLHIPVKDVYERYFSQQSIYMMFNNLVKRNYFLNNSASAETGVKRHVFIIDEINRGNIPSIFGELITLIEPDKRNPGPESITLTLPYSKDSFSVPNNVYLLGTMNTADRSVEAMDIALRRRFAFREVVPEPDLIPQPEEFPVDLARMLQTINDRIEYLLDRDHKIGHSYFMEMAESEDPEIFLKEIFARKVIPLLEEYFYGQPEKIGMVLGGDFVHRVNGNNHTEFAWNFSDGLDMPEEKILYEISDPMSFETLDPFIHIYEEV